jgi:hypothetical protein
MVGCTGHDSNRSSPEYKTRTVSCFFLSLSLSLKKKKKIRGLQSASLLYRLSDGLSLSLYILHNLVVVWLIKTWIRIGKWIYFLRLQPKQTAISLQQLSLSTITLKAYLIFTLRKLVFLPWPVADARSLDFKWFLFDRLVSRKLSFSWKSWTLTCTLELNSRCNSNSNCGSPELRNLSSYGRTAKEIPTSKSSVSIAWALPWVCASTNRLPRIFHIGCPKDANSEIWLSKRSVLTLCVYVCEIVGSKELWRWYVALRFTGVIQDDGRNPEPQ